MQGIVIVDSNRETTCSWLTNPQSMRSILVLAGIAAADGD